MGGSRAAGLARGDLENCKSKEGGGKKLSGTWLQKSQPCSILLVVKHRRKGFHEHDELVSLTKLSQGNWPVLEISVNLWFLYLVRRGILILF